MTRPVVVDGLAREEMKEAASWYATHSQSARQRFLRALREALSSIETNPEMYAVVFGRVRRAPVRPFPYGLYYRVEEARTVVVACFHGSRDPRLWQERA